MGSQRRYASKVDEGLREIMPGYLASRRQEVAEMQALIEDGNFEKIHFLAHKLRGHGGSYGLDVLSRIGRDLEKSSLSCRSARTQSLVETYRKYLSRLVISYTPS